MAEICRKRQSTAQGDHGVPASALKRELAMASEEMTLQYLESLQGSHIHFATKRIKLFSRLKKEVKTGEINQGWVMKTFVYQTRQSGPSGN